MRRRIIRIASLGALLVLAPAALLLALAGTGSGTRLLLDAGAHLAGASFTAGSVRGTLLGALHLRGVSWRGTTWHADIARLDLDWEPAALLHGRLRLHRLYIQGLHATGPAARGPLTLAALSRFPLRVRVDRASFEDITIKRGTSTLVIDRVQLATHLSGGRLVLDHLAVTTPAATLVATGELGSAPPHTFEARVHWRVKLAGAGELRGAGVLHGDAARIAFEQRLEGPAPGTLTGTIAPLSANARMELRAAWQAFTWPGRPRWKIRAGRARLHGTLADLSLAITGGLQTPVLALERARLSLQGGVAAAAPYPFHAVLAWSADATRAGDRVVLAGTGELRGDRGAVHIQHVLYAPVRLSTTADLDLHGTTTHLRADGSWSDLHWPLAGAPRWHSRRGSYHLSGTLAHLSAHIDAALDGNALPVHAVELKLQGAADTGAPYALQATLDWHGRLPGGGSAGGRLRVDGDRTRVRFEQHLQTPFAVDASGAVDLSGDVPVVEAHGSWRGATWPPGGAASWHSRSGRFELHGRASAWQAQVHAELATKGLPAGVITLAAHGDRDGARLAPLTLDMLGGRVTATGHVAWTPVRRWELALDARGIDPGRYWPAWPGKLDAHATSRGELAGGVARLETTLDRLAGRLRGYRVQASGNAALAGRHVTALHLDLRSGKNHIELSGSAGARLDLAYTLDAPALAGLWPGLSGRASGRGHITGTADAPRVQTKLQAHDIGFGAYGAASLALAAQMDAASTATSTMNVEVRDARAGNQIVKRATLEARGTLAAQRLEAHAEGPLGDLVLALHGGYAAGSWRGRIANLHYTTPAGQRWVAQPASALAAGRGGVHLAHTCLSHAAARVCASLALAANGKLAGQARLTGLPLALVRPWLPDSLAVQGTLAGRLDLAGSSKTPLASLALEASPGKLHFREAHGPPLDLVFHDLHLDAKLRGGRVHAQAGLVLDGAGHAQATLVLGPGADFASRSLSASVDAHFYKLAAVAVLAPRLEDVGGTLALHATLGGRAGAPTVAGSATLTGATARIPELGVALSGAHLQAVSRGGDRIHLSGGVSSGGGKLALKGTADLSPAAGWPASISIQGKDFEAVRLPDVHAFVSPALTVRHDAKLTEVTGKVVLPKADIRLRQLPAGAVTVSSDETIVGAPSSKPAPATAMPVRGDVVLQLGPHVHFSGLGVQTRLTGSVHVVSAPGQPALAEGQINLVDGRYEAYGQKLTVDRGRFLFAGPIDDPALNVRATRTAGDVTAGLQIDGTVKKPQAHVFAVPAMPDTEALSYLLTGRPLASASRADAGMLAQAALSLGLKNGATLTQQIAHTFGLDELSFGSSGTGSNAQGGSLLLGKYLTPDLYVRYALGLFGDPGQVQLEYRLNKHLRLQAESGTSNRGVDLLYKIER